jgi:hypothetical protein
MGAFEFISANSTVLIAVLVVAASIFVWKWIGVLPQVLLEGGITSYILRVYATSPPKVFTVRLAGKDMTFGKKKKKVCVFSLMCAKFLILS